MSRKGSLILAFLLLQVTLSMAQKVKYKDLIELLNAKQYEMAEPFLKRYLKENDDNASAYLFMGIIYQEKSLQNDLLKQTEALILNLDSAIYFYEKAHPMITEKEIKKNDENYQMYTRRDLRTGEFGIKQSDVQLDLETRTKALKEKQAKVKPLKNHLSTIRKVISPVDGFL
jgi:tetratricopeptide (TPR) repeat protein